MISMDALLVAGVLALAVLAFMQWDDAMRYRARREWQKRIDARVLAAWTKYARRNKP